MFADGTLKPWTAIVPRTMSPTPIHHFQYFRVREAWKQHLGPEMIEPLELQELTYVIKADSPKNMISILYRIALTSRMGGYNKSRLAWQQDLGVTITDAIWAYSCEHTKQITLNGRHRLIHFKYINRTYHTPVRLHRFGLRDADACDRCMTQRADFFHLAWECPGVHQYWTNIFHEISDMIGIETVADPLIALLGYTRDMPKAARRLVAMSTLMAKRRLAMCWMRGPLPTIAHWRKDLHYCNTQTENYNDLLPPKSRPKNYWGLYKEYTTRQAMVTPGTS